MSGFRAPVIFGLSCITNFPCVMCRNVSEPADPCVRQRDLTTCLPLENATSRIIEILMRICIFSIFMEHGLDFYGTRDIRNLGSVRSETPEP